MNEEGEIYGMVDVLKLTYATLEQINSMSTGDSEGPAWNRFWMSLENETESMVSGEGSHHHARPDSSRMMSPELTRERALDSVAPGDSASHAGMESPPHSAVAATPELPPSEIPFPFKFKAPSGRVHRLQVTAAQGIETFVSNVTAKLGSEVEAIGGAPTVDDGKMSGAGYALSYLDSDGDSVSITTDHDLLEAILLARQSGRDKVDLFVHDPDKPPVAAPVPVIEPVAIPTPPASSIVRERRKQYDGEDSEEDEEDDDASSMRRMRKTKVAAPQDQVITGVPNELLLPGAIVTLAVVIIGVFTITRMSNR
jgi:hypothetical protein